MDLKFLENLNNDTLCDIYCHLNKWKFPDYIKEYKPKNWELLPNKMKSEIIKPYMDYIESKVSEKELSRKHNNDMSDTEFEEYWNNRKPLSNTEKVILKILQNIEKSNLN